MRCGSAMGRSGPPRRRRPGDRPLPGPGRSRHLGLRLQPRRPLPGDHASSRPCPDGLGHRPARGRRERPGPRPWRRPDSARTAGGSPWPMRMASSSSTTWRPVSPAGAGAGRGRATWPSVPTGPRSRSSTMSRNAPPAGFWRRRPAGSSGRFPLRRRADRRRLEPRRHHAGDAVR